MIDSITLNTIKVLNFFVIKEYIMFRRLVRSGDLEPIKKYLGMILLNRIVFKQVGRQDKINNIMLRVQIVQEKYYVICSI